jgi:hypothetical protein
MSRTVRQVFSVNGIPTDVDSAVLSDPTGTYGVKRNDTDAVVVADGTAMTRTGVGTYEYEFSDSVGISYTAYVEFQYGSSSYYVESDFEASGVTGSGLGSLALTYARIKERVGHYLFGIREDFTVDQLSDMDDCIADGLRRVYAAHEWSFFRPIVEVTTTAEESEVDMPTEFDSVANDSQLAYAPDDNAYYPSVTQRGDQFIRRLEQGGQVLDRPVYYSVRTVKFNPLVGSLKVLAFYPTPDQAYTMRVPMVLRPVMLSTDNQQPIGGDVLSQVIIEACLASAEHNFEEREHIHEKRYLEMIALAIRNDLERSCPTSLGPDIGDRGKYGKFSVFGYDYQTREQRIGRLTLDGNGL